MNETKSLGLLSLMAESLVIYCHPMPNLIQVNLHLNENISWWMMFHSLASPGGGMDRSHPAIVATPPPPQGGWAAHLTSLAAAISLHIISLGEPTNK